METAIITYESDLRTEATHTLSGSKIITDAPLDNNGKGSAFSPTDLLSTSLACCMITLAGIKAEKNGFDLGKVKSAVYKTMGIDPRRVIKIKIDLFFEKNYTSDEKEIIEEAAHNCPVAKSLHPEIIQEITFYYNHNKK